jgi:aspartyl aminopeptidase
MQAPVTKDLDELYALGTNVAKKFLEFNYKGVSPYHVVSQLYELCKSRNLVYLEEDQPWKLERGKSYFLTRGGFSSFVAFHIPKNINPDKIAVKIFGSHCDSPCIRLAPKFHNQSHGFEQACVQLYGGGMWHTWLDRDLLLAGRVIIRKDNELKYKLYHSGDAIAKISTLAIHLQKDDSKLELNKETDLRPLIASSLFREITGNEKKKDEGGLKQRIADSFEVKVEDIINFDLCFADSVPPALFGLNKEFVSAPRMDNLYSVFCSVEAFFEYISDEKKLSEATDITIAAAFDHEEIGSKTYVGADSSFMVSVVTRILNCTNISTDKDIFSTIMARSILISADTSHSIHPNFPQIHQKNHIPEMNKGVVLKFNINGNYVSDALSGSVVKNIASKAGIPLTEYIVSNDSPCGYTLGPLLSSKLGCLAVDVGAPQLGMHSIRETAGVLDFYYYKEFFLRFMQASLANELPKI